MTRKLLWIPSSAPDAIERRLWDRLSQFVPIICRTERQVMEALAEHAIGVVVVNGTADGWHAADLASAVQAERPAVPLFVRHARLPVFTAVQPVFQREAAVLAAEADEATVAAAVAAIVSSGAGTVPAAPPRGFPLPSWRQELIGTSDCMERICATVGLIAVRRGTVLVTGETGTGKEVLARAIHAAGNRANHPFVAVNCSAIPGTLLESELFGHVRGAFTGAHAPRIGRFEQAQNGTLFLDEIGDLGLDLQTKLLRVLQEKKIERLGSSQSVPLDLRMIAATHVDLSRRVREGTFREDLFYRLNVIPIQIPPLRDRKGDIPELVHHFLRKICSAEDLQRREVTAAAMIRLMEYSWPGNIRQLENAVERAIALCGDRLLLDESDFDLPGNSLSHPEPETPSELPDVLPDSGFDYDKAVSRFEWSLLSRALRKAGGNKQAAADLLGLKRTTLAAKVKVLSTTAGCTVM